MNYKTAVALTLSSTLFLGACSFDLSPSNDTKEVITESEQGKEVQAVVSPAIDTTDSYYRTVLPFRPSVARGMTQKRVSSRLELDEIETGLMRHSTQFFDPEKYYYQEGQLLEADQIAKWLLRKGKAGDGVSDPEGLNPAYTSGKSYKEKNQKSPLILSHILEQDYMLEEDKKLELGGTSIALVLNSEYVFQDENYGPTYTVKLDEKKVVAEGKQMANTLVKKMRKTQGMKTTPIHVALYLQEKEGSPVSGHYLSSAFIGRGNQISANDWKNYDERYYYYPSARATNDVRDDAAKFDLFKDRLEDYFPNYTGMMGEGFYQEGELKKLEMKIPVQFYGKAELVAFVQYVTYLLENRWEYNRNIPTTITVTNLNGDTEAMLFLDPDTKKPIVKIR